MKHYGDITKINGCDVEIPDVVIGGSPCQDLSVAGKRAGLDGERSGLFMEQIRIIKEMRKRSIENGAVGPIPRYMVWENVPGALSSNGGEDFRIVLEETAKIAQADAVVPKSSKGKWANAGCIMGNRWSIAWRIHDAQFWGVPQRRRRISLVADFNGMSAPEIVFDRHIGADNAHEILVKREGGTRDIESCGETWEGAATDTEGCPTVNGSKSYGFDGGATRDVGELFLEETSKSLTNGTCPGHHNHVCTDRR